ncbi:MAG: glycosyltransferase family 9 protein [Mucilaginibacter sp.]
MTLNQQEIKKIGVFRALQLGDMLCAIPAIRALRSAYPDAEIILLGLPWAKSFTERFSEYFDGYIHFPGYPGLPEQSFDEEKYQQFLININQEKFDLILQMQGDGSIVNEMIAQYGAKYTAGYKLEGHYAPDNGLYIDYPNYGSEIDRHLLLMEFLGIPSKGNQLEFPLSEGDVMALDQLQLGIEPGRYVCIHPGSRGAWRQWPVEYFASLADFCTEQGYKVLITGTKEEAGIVQAVKDNMKDDAINIAGKTSIGAAAALIKDAAMLISNCTGVSHIAAAFGTPSIVISMDGEPERWGPVNKELHHTINWLASQDFHLVFRETVAMLNRLETGVLAPR